MSKGFALLVACILLIGLAAAVHAEEPSLAAPAEVTRAKVQQVASEVFRELTVDYYNEKGQKNPAWNRAARRFLTGFADHLAELPDAPPLKVLQERGMEAVVDLGCKDRLVRVCYGIVLHQMGENISAATLIDGPAGHMHNAPTDHPVLIKAMAQRYGRAVAEALRRPTNVAVFTERASKFFEQAITELPDAGERTRVLLGVINDEYLENLEADDYVKLYERLKNKEGVDPWVLAIIGGRAHKDMAWMQRGSGWAPEVTEQGWLGFKEHLTKARELLLDAHRAKPDRPEAATELIRVTMGGHGVPGRDVRYWFDQAVKAQIDHEPAYSALLWASQPRWGGSFEQMAKFARAWVAGGRFDTQIPYQAWNAYTGIVAGMRGDYVAALRVGDMYETLQQMCRGYQKHSANAERPQQVYWATFAAALAMRAGRFEEAAAFIKPFGGNLNGHAFEKFNLTAPAAVGQINALGHPNLKTMTQAAAALLAKGEHEAAAAAFDAAAKEHEGRPWVSEYWKAQADVARLLHQLVSKREVRIQPRQGFAGWRIESGEWSIQPDGALVGESENAGLRILLDIPIAGAFELNGEIELDHHRYRKNFNGAVFLGDSSGEPSQIFNILLAEKQVQLYAPLQQPIANNAPVERMNRFRLIVRGPKIDAWVNDQQVLRQASLPNYHPAKVSLIGVGGAYWYEGARIKFRNLRLKLLDE